MAATYVRHGMGGRGAWGTGTFENDDALDWLDQLESGDADTLETVDGEYLEAPDATVMLAAAEIVAASAGHLPGDELPEEVTAYLATGPDLSGLNAAARAAVVRVLAEDSELHELWKDSEDYASWRDGVTDLQARLAR